MKFIVALLAFVALANLQAVRDTTAYDYLKKYGVPLAQRIQDAEEMQSRIIHGQPSSLGQYPWQAGLIIQLVDSSVIAVCGSSLVSKSRLVTAAHCWYDGQSKSKQYTVVLGSNYLFSGGTRINTQDVIVHPKWNPKLVRNDISVIRLPKDVIFTKVISPVSIPSGEELNESFAGEEAIASGFGMTNDHANITKNQYLSVVHLRVISNTACNCSFPLVIQETNICTSGFDKRGVCSGDSGGPLVIPRKNRTILVGITSFGARLCETKFPSVFARVTSYVDFIKENS